MIKALQKTPSRWLTLEDCERIFKAFKDRLDFNEPIPQFNSRFEGKLESIINSVSQTYSGKHLNISILEAAAAYFNQIIRGHPFKNGNKRMAVLYTHVFLLLNDLDYDLTYSEMFTFAIVVAKAGEEGIGSEKTKILCKQIISRFTKVSI